MEGTQNKNLETRNNPEPRQNNVYWLAYSRLAKPTILYSPGPCALEWQCGELDPLILATDEEYIHGFAYRPICLRHFLNWWSFFLDEGVNLTQN